MFGEKPAAAEYTLTYDLNSGTGTAPTRTPAFAGTNFVAATLPADVVAPSGTVFREWNAAADGSGASYPAGSVVTQPASNLTLFAQWITTGALEKAITDAKALDREHYVPSSWSTLAPALAAAEAVLKAAVLVADEADVLLSVEVRLHAEMLALPEQVEHLRKMIGEPVRGEQRANFRRVEITRLIAEKAVGVELAVVRR